MSVYHRTEDGDYIEGEKVVPTIRKITCRHCGTKQEPFVEWDEIICRSCDKKIRDA